MNVHYETNFLQEKEKPVGLAATIGFFDGVHKGHKYLLSRLNHIAHEKNLSSMVVTFSNHPREIFSPYSTVPLLSSTHEKRVLIEKAGIDKCLMLVFDKELASLTSEQFIRQLAYKYNVKVLLVGHNHRFGSDVNSKIKDYVTFGLIHGVEIILENAYLENQEDVSSSKIRNALFSGNVEKANKYLGYDFPISGLVINGKKIGRTIGFPTANIFPQENKLIPRIGVYAVKVFIEDTQYIGMLNIGNRPTVGGENTTLEVNIINFNGDLYGKIIRLSLSKYIREEKKYDSKEDLMAQIALDKEEIEQYYNNI